MSTRYDSLLTTVVEEENLQLSLAGELAEEATLVDTLERRMYASSDRALNASELAQAEQLRIANLIAIAQAPFANSGDVRATLPVRKRAMRMAIEGLGLDE